MGSLKTNPHGCRALYVRYEEYPITGRHWIERCVERQKYPSLYASPHMAIRSISRRSLMIRAQLIQTLLARTYSVSTWGRFCGGAMKDAPQICWRAQNAGRPEASHVLAPAILYFIIWAGLHRSLSDRRSHMSDVQCSNARSRRTAREALGSLPLGSHFRRRDAASLDA